MPISVQIDGRFGALVTLNAFREDDAAGRFWVYSAEDESVGISIPFPYERKPTYDCSQADILILLNPFHVEASAMEVTLQPKTKRLGFIFSLNSIGSKNHKLSESEHFKKASHAAVYKIIEQFIVRNTETISIGSRANECTIDELFDGELVVLAAHKPWISDAGIELNQLHADLHRHGYVLAESPSENSPKRLNTVRSNFDSATKADRLGLRALSITLATDGLLAKLIGRRLSCPDDTILRFFYLYQIVERILELELRNHTQKLLVELSAVDPNGMKIINTFHALKDAFSEKTRLKELFEVRSKNSLQSSPTLTHMTEFLRGCDVEESGSYCEIFYKIRNVVFHAWWSIPTKLISVFEEIVSGVENDIPELLLNYELPLGVITAPKGATGKEIDYTI
ncbi:hypothetical protein [Nibricoccus aquaticus]|uniref:hypothetical protein n=1 Tax=Nibricoccus aquaticus TaxID=2576891 RepID=UPI0010FE48C3|nr:hypothetical protein [Nibricoccus aquaticus]